MTDSIMIPTDRIFIVAELSANHNHRLDVAVDTIRAAARAGADAVKLQTYTPDTITLDVHAPDFRIDGGLWDGRYLYDLYREAYTPWEWHEELFRIAREEGLVCFSTPFDPTAVDFLEELGNPIYKIASFEITDTPLIGYAASKGKPMVMSTGIGTLAEIGLAVDACRQAGNDDVTLLKCTSAYPATVDAANLATMPDLRDRFGVRVGLSDHTLGALCPVVAASLGAVMIEKHFILDHSIGGPDAAFSMDEAEFAGMVRQVRQAEAAIGHVKYRESESMTDGRQWCRSLYVTRDMEPGDRLTPDNVRSVRPGYGMSPRHLPAVLGLRVNRRITAGTPLTPDAITGFTAR